MVSGRSAFTSCSPAFSPFASLELPASATPSWVVAASQVGGGPAGTPRTPRRPPRSRAPAHNETPPVTPVPSPALPLPLSREGGGKGDARSPSQVAVSVRAAHSAPTEGTWSTRSSGGVAKGIGGEMDKEGANRSMPTAAAGGHGPSTSKGDWEMGTRRDEWGQGDERRTARRCGCQPVALRDGVWGGGGWVRGWGSTKTGVWVEGVEVGRGDESSATRRQRGRRRRLSRHVQSPHARRVEGRAA